MNYLDIKSELQAIIDAINETEVPVKLPVKTELLTSRIEAAITDIKFYRLTGKQINDLLFSTLAHIENNVAANIAVDEAFHDLRVKYDKINSLNDELHNRFEAKCEEYRKLENAGLESARNHNVSIECLGMELTSNQERMNEYKQIIQDLRNEIVALKTHIATSTKASTWAAPNWQHPVWQQPYPIQLTTQPQPNVIWAHNK